MGDITSLLNLQATLLKKSLLTCSNYLLFTRDLGRVLLNFVTLYILDLLVS